MNRRERRRRRRGPHEIQCPCCGEVNGPLVVDDDGSLSDQDKAEIRRLVERQFPGSTVAFAPPPPAQSDGSRVGSTRPVKNPPHLTDGTPCWCNPIVEDYRPDSDGGEG